MRSVNLINPTTNQPFPHVEASGRKCFAIEPGQEFAVAIELGHSSTESVVIVDGRDTLTNLDGDTSASGIVTSGTYVCHGFRTDANTVRRFVAGELGHGSTVSEKNGSVSMAGLVVVALWSGRSGRHGTNEYSILRGLEFERTLSRGGARPLDRDVFLCTAGERGEPLTRGGSLGAVAGAELTSRVGEVEWTRTHQRPEEIIVEYDTLLNFRARNIFIPILNTAWPRSPSRRFSDPSTL